MSKVDGPDNGERAEEWAEDELGLTIEDEEHYDGVRDDGTKVEIKGCVCWMSNGTGRTHGRLRFWSGSHERLAAEDGVYLIVVYEDDGDDDIDVQQWAYVDPETIEAEVEWSNFSHRLHKGTEGRLNWTYIFEEDT